METDNIQFALSNVREAMKLLNENENGVSKIRNQLLNAEQHLMIVSRSMDLDDHLFFEV